MDLTSLIPLAGGLLGAFGSSDSKQTASSDRTPWGPSQGWLTSNINSGQQLQDYYQKNPLSADQLQAYGNSKALTGNARNLFGNVTNQLNSTQFFDRSNPLNRPAALQFTAQGFGDPQAATSGGLLNSSVSAPFAGFSKPAASQIQANPFGTGISDRSSGYSSSDNSPNWYEITSPEERMAYFQENPMLASITGWLNENAKALPYIGQFTDAEKAKQYAQEARGTYVNPTVQAAIQANDEYNYTPSSSVGSSGPLSGSAWSNSSTGGFQSQPSSSPDSLSPSQSASLAAAMSSWGGYGSSDSSDSSSDSGGYAKGGLVKKSSLVGPDPDGPDEGAANLQSGEYVIKKSAAKKLGKGLLDAVNSGDKQKIRGLLA